jgi:hypothetical protein
MEIVARHGSFNGRLIAGFKARPSGVNLLLSRVYSRGMPKVESVPRTRYSPLYPPRFNETCLAAHSRRARLLNASCVSTTAYER